MRFKISDYVIEHCKERIEGFRLKRHPDFPDNWCIEFLSLEELKSFFDNGDEFVIERDHYGEMCLDVQ